VGVDRGEVTEPFSELNEEIELLFDMSKFEWEIYLDDELMD
jgi:hypothetical protein